MSSTTFVDGETLIIASWLNDVNNAVYNTLPAMPTSVQLPVRQTVLSGPVDSSGFAAFGGSTGSTTVTATGTLVASAANGFNVLGQVNRIGSITTPSWTGLSTNGTMYLYLDIAANGTCTTGSTTLAPTYRWGGADVVTNNQFTFNIQEMVGKVGNGTSAVQTYRVFVGQVTVAAGVVSAIIWYALQGRYDSGWTNTIPAGGVVTVKNHNIGTIPYIVRWENQCLTAEQGFAVGDIIDAANNTTPGSTWTVVPVRTALTLTVVQGSNVSFAIVNKGTGTSVIGTNANWAYRGTAQRGW